GSPQGRGSAAGGTAGIVQPLAHLASGKASRIQDLAALDPALQPHSLDGRKVPAKAAEKWLKRFALLAGGEEGQRLTHRRQALELRLETMGKVGSYGPRPILLGLAMAGAGHAQKGGSDRQGDRPRQQRARNGSPVGHGGAPSGAVRRCGESGRSQDAESVRRVVLSPSNREAVKVICCRPTGIATPRYTSLELWVASGAAPGKGTVRPSVAPRTQVTDAPRSRTLPFR